MLFVTQRKAGEVRENNPYHVFKYELIDDAKRMLLEHPDGFESTEYFFLYFDFMSCPFIDESIRLQLARKIKELTGTNFKNQKLDKIMRKDFLVSWRDEDYLENSLEKREFVFSYE
jgi:hypothetical protein